VRNLKRERESWFLSMDSYKDLHDAYNGDSEEYYYTGGVSKVDDFIVVAMKIRMSSMITVMPLMIASKLTLFFILKLLLSPFFPC